MMSATRYHLLILLCVIIFCTRASAQSTALRLYTEGDSLHALSDFTGASAKFDQSRSLAIKSEEYTVYFDAFGMLLDCLHKKLEIRRLELEIDSMHTQLDLYQDQMPTLYYQQKKDVADIFTMLVFIAYGDSEGALDLLLPLLDSLKALLPSPDSTSIIVKQVKLHAYISDAYMAQGNYDQTLYYANEAIILSKSLNNKDGWLLYPHNILVSHYVATGRNEEAIEELNHILDIIPSIEQRQAERTVAAYLKISKLHLKNESLDSAYHYLTLLKEIDKTGAHILDASILEGEIHYARAEYEKSKQAYVNINNTLADKGAEESELSAMCDLQLGKIAMQQDRPQDALGLLHSALLNFTDQFDHPDPLSSPNSELVFSRLMPVEIIYFKSKALYDLYGVNQDSKYLDASWLTINLGIEFVDKLRKSYYDSEDKAFLIEQSYRIFEHALRICHFQHTLSDQESWIDTAFTLMERSKALNLMDAVMHQNARQFAGIPEALLKTESALRLEISGQEEAIQRLKSSENYSKSSLRINISELRKKEGLYRDLIATIEADHPSYYQLRYGAAELNLKDIQSLLKKDETIIEYFMGASDIYTLVISKSNKRLITSHNAPLVEGLVAKYKSAIQTCIDGAGDTANDSLYLNTASALYNSLVNPLQPLKKSIIIVQDGALNYLSYAGLLTKSPTQFYDFREQPYMLWDHEISYCYSMSLYRELHQREKTDVSRSVVFAPEFDATDVLGQLTYNKTEAQFVANQTKAESIVGRSCTASAVRAQLQTGSGYRVAHFATHGVADVANGTDSYLQFAGPADGNKLYARELYNYTMNADLVYLSACETGSGQLRRGEGVISIARAFFYAGTRSLVTALWSISDERAKDLTIGFYDALMKGASIDAAVVSAQRQFLKDLPNEDRYLAHPAYWSALVPIGSTSAIVTQNKAMWVLYLAGLVVILLIGRRSLMKSQKTSK